jgi:hypothetical protein
LTSKPIGGSRLDSNQQFTPADGAGVSSQDHSVAGQPQPQVPLPARDLPGNQPRLFQPTGPEWCQAAMGRTTHGIFIDPHLWGEKPAEQVDPGEIGR